jgi:hypothetical protein
MVERVLRTTRDANTALDRTHKGGFPILQVPFRMASSFPLSQPNYANVNELSE